ncbi:MAG: sigma-70 family RNA polymerase sigma factor [Actinomycetota bacterium]|nr:sigma-70 family RNA polymerase sigma factor [Actinomycetota bacterium]
MESSATRQDCGRQEAFARYVLPEVEVLVRVARSMTTRRDDAEDLVQDTLLRAYRGLDGFDGRHPRAWLLTILRNAHVNRTRRRRPVLVDDGGAAMDVAAEVGGAGDQDPEAVVVDRWFDVAVADAFEQLPERYRQVVRLVDIEGLSYKETAVALALPEGTVMSRLHRARARMRSRLDAAGMTPRGG